MDALSPWQGFYNDPWFWQFPMATLAISMASFLTVATPWTIVAWLDPESMRKYKIQQKPFEFKKYFWPSIAVSLSTTSFWPVYWWQPGPC